MVTMTATQFNREPSTVKRLVTESNETVVVTDHGRPIMRVTQCEPGEQPGVKPPGIDLVKWLEMDDDTEIEFPKVGLGLRPVEF